MKAHKTDQAPAPTIRLVIQFDLPVGPRPPGPTADSVVDLDPGEDFLGWTYDEIDAMPLGVIRKKPGT